MKLLKYVILFQMGLILFSCSSYLNCIYSKKTYNKKEMELVNEIISNPNSVLNLEQTFPDYFDSTIVCPWLKDIKYLKNFKRDFQEEYNNYEDINIQYNAKVPLIDKINFLSTLDSNTYTYEYKYLQHLRTLDTNMYISSILIYNSNKKAKLMISFVFFKESNPFILEMKLSYLYGGNSRISW